MREKVRPFIVAAILLGVAAIVSSPYVFYYAHYGRPPLDSKSNNPEAVPVGATEEEVHARLGPPHYRWDNRGEEGWVYYEGLLGMWAWTVWFDGQGRVTR